MHSSEMVQVYGTHSYMDPPVAYGVLDVYCEPDPSAPGTESLVGIVVPLDPTKLDELQGRLASGPIEVLCHWNWWDDESPDVWRRIELFGDGSPADLHEPPGGLTIDENGVVVLRDLE